jgi:hypothetical protein
MGTQSARCRKKEGWPNLGRCEAFGSPFQAERKASRSVLIGHARRIIQCV